MGLFTPGWKKNPEKAIKRIEEKQTTPGELLSIVAETDFSGPEGVKARSMAIERLRGFREDPEGKAALEQLARTGATPLIRCEAAYVLGTDEGRKIVRETIADAYADPGIAAVSCNPENWIRDISDGEIQMAAYKAAAYGFKRILAPMLKDRDARFYAIMQEEDSDTIVKLLDGFNGTQEQYSQILKKVDNRGVNAIIPRLPSSCEDLLAELADAGNSTASFRLLRMDLEKYAKRYPLWMNSDQIIKAIELGVYTQDELEKKIMDSEDLHRKSTAWAAMEHITEPERLERILLTHKVPPFSKRQGGSWEAWNLELINRLKDREDIMLRYILIGNQGHNIAMETEALKYVHSHEALRKIAMKQNTVAFEAAQQLPDSDLSALTRSEHKKVAEWATGILQDQRIVNASEEEALEAMRWILEKSKDASVYRRALRRVSSQTGLLEALTDITAQWDPLGTETKSVREELLKKITDGPLLTDWCLEHPGKVEKEEIVRLRELIAGTPEEKRFTDRNVEVLMGTVDSFAGAHQLALYYDIKNAEALWRFGGEEYIKRIINILETERERDRAQKAANRLAVIYSSVPESHSGMEYIKGKQYRKHVDFIDEHCMGNSEDREVSVIADLDKYK